MPPLPVIQQTGSINIIVLWMHPAAVRRFINKKLQN